MEIENNLNLEFYHRIGVAAYRNKKKILFLVSNKTKIQKMNELLIVAAIGTAASI